MKSGLARAIDHDLHDLALSAALDARAVERCDAHARAWIDAGDPALWARAARVMAADAERSGLRCDAAVLEDALDGVRRRSVDECPHCQPRPPRRR